MTDRLLHLSEQDRKTIISQGSDVFSQELKNSGHPELARHSFNFSLNCLVYSSDKHLLENQFDKNDISAINNVAQGMLNALKSRH